MNSSGLLRISLLILCINFYLLNIVEAYNLPEALYFGIDANSNSSYFRDEKIDMSYIIKNNHGRSSDFSESQKNVKIKLPANFSFSAITITDQDGMILTPNNTTNILSFDLRDSTEKPKTNYVNLTLDYAKFAPPGSFDFLKDRECIELNWSTPVSKYYSKSEPEHIIHMVNRKPVLSKCFMKSHLENISIYCVEGYDTDSEVLNFILTDIYGTELQNLTYNNTNKIFIKDVNYTGTAKPSFASLYDGIIESDKIILDDSFLSEIIYFVSQFYYVFLLIIFSILVSYFLTTEISFIKFIYDLKYFSLAPLCGRNYSS